MKGQHYLILSLCNLMLALAFGPAPAGLPRILAGAALPAGTTATNSVVYLPLAANQYNPLDIPIYRNSFESITDLAAKGVSSSNATIAITTENVDYASGSKALKVYGTLAGAPWSNISANFSLKKFIDADTLDLSDKTIGFSFFIPNSSPFDGGIGISATKGNIVVALAGGPATRGDWVDVQADVAEEYKNKSWAYTNGTDDEARDTLKHCETLSILGSRSTAGTPAAAYFYVDNLNWIRSDRFNLPISNSIDSLRKYAADQHFAFGLFSADFLMFGPENDPWNWKGDPWYAYLVAQEGAVNTIEDFTARPGEDYGNFNYDPVQDARVLLDYQFGQTYHLTTLGYGIGSWYGANGLPDWIKELAFPDATQALLLYHTERSLRYTRGKNPVWLLFNENINQICEGNTGLKNRQPYGCGGPDPVSYSAWAADENDSSLIKAAFIKARQVDPGATLLFNDYDNEDIGWIKSDYMYTFATGLKTEGIPIDGVGFELHNYIDPNGKLVVFRELLPYDFSNTQRIDMDTYLQNVDLNVKRYASAGLKVAFTEVEGQIRFDDIDFNTPAGRAEYAERLQYQADYFAGLLKIAMDNTNVIMYHMWGGTDRYQNVQPWPGYGNGFILDKNYQPKPAYYALLDLLKGP